MTFVDNCDAIGEIFIDMSDNLGSVNPVFPFSIFQVLYLRDQNCISHIDDGERTCAVNDFLLGIGEGCDSDGACYGFSAAGAANVHQHVGC